MIEIEQCRNSKALVFRSDACQPLRKDLFFVTAHIRWQVSQHVSLPLITSESRIFLNEKQRASSRNEQSEKKQEKRSRNETKGQIVIPRLCERTKPEFYLQGLDFKFLALLKKPRL